jgi:hypothetical protein
MTTPITLDNNLDKFLQEAISKYPLADKKQLKELLYLVEALLKITNNPSHRDNLEKAKFIHDYLLKYGVSNEIVEVENNGTWYVVKVTQGVEEVTPETFNLFAMFHHDTIVSNDDQSFELVHARNGKILGISHAYILDDTVQVAAAILETINFTNNPPENKNYKLNVFFTDGEEVNTLGSAGIFQKLHNNDELNHINMCLIGEATGQYDPQSLDNLNDILPKVCYANRGKITFTMNQTEKRSTVDKFAHWLMLFRYLSKCIYKDSFEKDLPAKPSLNHTSLSATYGHFSQDECTAFLEARTNNEYDNNITAQTLNKSHLLTKTKILNSELLTEFEKPVLIDLHKFTQIGNKVKITPGENIHPGRYNPYLRNDIFSALEIILSFMSEDERKLIESIQFGNRLKPNTIPQELEINFKDNVNFEEIVKRTEKVDAWNNSIETFYQILDYRNTFEVKVNDKTPPRNALSTSHGNWSKVENIRKHFGDNVRIVFNSVSLSPEFGVFNAMSDVGPTTYEHFYSKAWMKNSKESICCIHLGAGNFNLLHRTKEILLIEELIISSVMYKDIFKSAIDHNE